jgi:lysophospholipase
MEQAPYHAETADGPETGSAYWRTTSDGVRIRVGVWPRTPKVTSKTKGTVFIFPGRTEHIEKSGPAAREFAKRGYSSLAIDWRGQGLADRLLDNPQIGHVESFADYQRDVAAVMELAEELNLPKPYFLQPHSMGGAIGLRTLLETNHFNAAAFSAPMWGIGLTPVQKFMARTFGPSVKALGKQNSFAPGTSEDVYVRTHPFEGNVLTSDPEMYEFLQRQIKDIPEIALGGPSANWALEAIKENTYLNAQTAPDVPIVCMVGFEESVVSQKAIRNRIATWPKGYLLEAPGARHEILMETPTTRTMFFDHACALFDAQL